MMAESFLTLMADYCEEDQQHISQWYNALQAAGFTGTQTPGLPFHISLATVSLEEEESAVALTHQVAARFAPLEVDIRHVGIFPGGKVLFAAPDMRANLIALQAACKTQQVNGFPWTPHTTLLIDEAETIGAAVPVLTRHFTPLRARIDRLHLCAFWPTREILRLSLRKGVTMPFTNIQAAFSSPALRRAFQDYFAELGVTVRNWEGLFTELDKRTGWTLVRQDEAGRIAAFLLGSIQEMRSDFFTTHIGFVEEMYVAPAFRRQGHGAALLQAAEARFRQQGCGCVLLTTDSAPAFFTSQGYLPQPGIRAKNGDPVFVKPLENPV